MKASLLIPLPLPRSARQGLLFLFDSPGLRSPDLRLLFACAKSRQKHTQTYGLRIPWHRPEGDTLCFAYLPQRGSPLSNSAYQNPPAPCVYPRVLSGDIAAAPVAPAESCGVETSCVLIRLCRGAHCAPAIQRAEAKFRRWYAAYRAAAPQRPAPIGPVGRRRSPAHQRRDQRQNQTWSVGAKINTPVVPGILKGVRPLERAMIAQ